MFWRRSFSVKIEKWFRSDREGFIYSYPSIVEIDVAIRDVKYLLM